MDLPSRLETPTNYNKVCKLKKSLYELKQSPQAWFDKFARTIVQHGYFQCQIDHTLSVKFSTWNIIGILILYVDDIILTGEHEKELTRLKKILAKEFEIKDFDTVKYFLGMEVTRSKKDIFIS